MASDQTTYGAATYGSGVYSPYTVSPAGLGDPETTGTPTLAQTFTTAPASLLDTDTLGGPGAQNYLVAPAGITDAATPGVAMSAGYAGTLIPASIASTEIIGAPALAATGATTPTSITDPAGIGAPNVVFTSAPTGYGAGLYSTGAYNGATTTAPTQVGPYPLIDPETAYTEADTDYTATGYGAGPYTAGNYAGTNVRSPYPLTDGETLGNPAVGGTASSDDSYGSGDYGSNLYPGTKTGDGDDATHLPTPPVYRIYPDPLHILGAGPWNPVHVWRGATNYGIGKGIQPARPQLQVPGIQSKSFTLRLNGGNEATVNLQMPRTKAIIFEEMVTDLWWRRRDPRTGKLEMIGRFNCSHNDLSTNDDGTLSSALQFQDYRLLMASRLVMSYKSTKTVTTSDGTKDVQSLTQWPKGTPVTEVMRWFMPTDLGLDLSQLDDDELLGTITVPFELPPTNSIDDTMAALFDVSEKAWEWWVETPTDVTLPPKVMAQIGYRGVDKGVTLFDYGTGPTPIATWSMRATSDTYANTLYFQGKDGGCVVDIPAAVTKYGRRDAQASDSSITGAIANYARAAYRKLATLADTRPTFTIVLKPGFWRGRAHIDVGDMLRLRIKLGAELLAYEYRVSEIQVDIDQAGAETVTLTLGAPLATANPRSQYSPLFRFRRALANFTPSADADEVVVVSPTFSNTFDN